MGQNYSICGLRVIRGQFKTGGRRFLRLFYNEKVVTLFGRERASQSERSEGSARVRYDALEPHSFGDRFREQ